MNNVHTRVLRASIEQVRPWIDAAWTGTDRDPFPRDVVKNWRKNPPGTDPLALVPGRTRIGHGPFAFRIESWDGERWRVSVETHGYQGWHGFDLRTTPDGCEITHRLEVQLSGSARVLWPLCFAPIHDWCVEAIFDRIEEAIQSGHMPSVTNRAVPWTASVAFRALRRSRKARRPPSSGRAAQPISD
jgi:hypothetical protein